MYKNLIYLLYLALLFGCAVKNGTAGIKENGIPWELQFRYRQGEPLLSHAALNLNNTIPDCLMSVSLIKAAWNESPIIVVKYKELSKAKVLEVYSRLKEDDRIEVLGMNQTY